MSNEQENKQNELTEAQRQQTQINTLLGLVNVFGDDFVIQKICDVFDIDYEDIKTQLPANEEDDLDRVQKLLDGDEGE